MPVCRECHARISKFDKDRCPVCGCLKPLEGQTSETIEFTQTFDEVKNDKSYRPTRKLTLFLLFFFVGFTGAPFFYLGWKKYGFIYLFCSLILIGAVGSILAFLTPLGVIWGYIIALILSYVISIVFGLVITFKDDIKDGSGEFLK